MHGLMREGRGDPALYSTPPPQITSIVDPQGNTSKYGYDARGNLTSITDPTGTTTEYQYDSRGYLTKMTNGLGEATSFTYDAESVSPQ